MMHAVALSCMMNATIHAVALRCMEQCYAVALECIQWRNVYLPDFVFGGNTVLETRQTEDHVRKHVDSGAAASKCVQTEL